MIRALALALLAAGGAAEAAPPPPIVNGESTSDWAAVGMLVAWDPSTATGGVYCSASLVAEAGIVTAAHCADAAEDYLAWGYSTLFAIGPSMEGIEQAIEVTSFVVHPDYRFDSGGVAADIAVGLLARSPTGLQPLPFPTASLDTAWYDQDLRLVGYGVTGDGLADAGIRRTATLPVYSLYGDFVLALDEDPAGSNACSGDSGGAALRELDGEMALVGVLSFVFPWHDPSQSCVGGGVGATRMDLFGAWVVMELGLDETSGTGGGGGSGGSGGSGGGSSSLGSEPARGGCEAAPLAPSPLLGPAAILALLLGLPARRRRVG